MRRYSTYNDETLLDLLKQDDEGAFTELYERYWKLLFSIAANKTGSLADAEEMVQEVFADFWKRRQVIEIKVSVKAYLAAAVKFQVYSFLAKKQKEWVSEQGVVSEQTPITPEQELDFKNLQISLQETISALPEKCQLIYLLKQEGLSNKEIASRLGISSKTVESQTTTAFRRLRTGIDYLFFIFFK